MQSHDVHHGIVSEVSVFQIQCWLSSPQGESLLEFIQGPSGNVAASQWHSGTLCTSQISVFTHTLITASLTPA